MKRLIKADFYKLIRRRESYLLLLILCIESSVSATIPKTGYAMFVNRCSISLSLVMELTFLAVILVAENYAKGTWYAEFLSGHTRKDILISKLIVYGLSALIIVTLNIGIPVFISSKMNGAEFSGGWYMILPAFLVKILFILSAATLTAILIRKRIITFAVGTAICFSMAKISEYLLEPMIPYICIPIVFLIGSFLCLIFSIKMFACDSDK